MNNIANNNVVIYYRVNENEEDSWEDTLIRNAHLPRNLRYKSVTRTQRVRYSNKLREMRRSKRLTEKKKEKSIYLVDFRNRDFRM